MTCDRKRKRVEGSRALLNYISMLKKNNFRYFSTGDESFFLYDPIKKTIWLPNDQDPPETSTDHYELQKIMICIFWSSHRIQLIKCLPEGETFNGKFFIEEILNELAQNKYVKDAKKNKKDGVSQFCAKNKMFILPHPPYSPDLAPSDFFLFAYIKRKAEGAEFSSPEELIQFIGEIFIQISPEVLNSVFLNWEERLKKCIEVEGDYFC